MQESVAFSIIFFVLRHFLYLIDIFIGKLYAFLSNLEEVNITHGDHPLSAGAVGGRSGKNRPFRLTDRRAVREAG